MALVECFSIGLIHQQAGGSHIYKYTICIWAPKGKLRFQHNGISVGWLSWEAWDTHYKTHWDLQEIITKVIALKEGGYIWVPMHYAKVIMHIGKKSILLMKVHKIIKLEQVTNAQVIDLLKEFIHKDHCTFPGKVTGMAAFLFHHEPIDTNNLLGQHKTTCDHIAQLSGIPLLQDLDKRLWLLDTIKDGPLSWIKFILSALYPSFDLKPVLPC